ncbi:MAG: metallophosphoesterase, partial [Pseudomonadota bacterium]
MPVTLADARLPEGLRVYAIGDVHGDMAALKSMRRKIDEDLARRPAQDWREVWLGDYVDRGPDSQGVIEALISWPEAERRICLRGNHDDYMHLFVEHGDPAILSQWLANGGITAVASYGLSIERLLLG